MGALRDLPRRAALAAVLIGGCTDEVVVFEPHGRGTDPSLIDATAPAPSPPDAGVVGDAEGEPAVEPPELEGPLPPDGSPSVSDHQIIAAFSQTCAIHQGDLYCWGDNRFGQRGTFDLSPLPSLTAGGPFSEVCAGEEHTCALRSDGVVLCWGGNARGELGLGDDAPRLSPTPVSAQRFVSIACGGHGTCGIGGEGELFCWGDDSEGQLARGTQSGDGARALGPVPVAPALRVGHVSVGQGHVCAIAHGGKLYCWGRNTHQQIGAASGDPQVPRPTPVDPEHGYVQVAAGQSHTCAIRDDGRLLCWGDQRYQLLGRDATTPGATLGPELVDDADDYTQIAVGWFHSCALKRDGTLRCWGRNVEGQLGTGDESLRSTPTRVGTDADWTALTAGQFHSCGMRRELVYCWGDNTLRQLGLDDPMRRSVPTLVPRPW